MQKIYLLLRNNQQSGPHTLEELQELSLKPTDLIWTEGKIGWKSPGELPALTNHQEKSIPKEPVTAATTEIKNHKATVSRIFVRLPGNRQAILPAADAVETSPETDPATALEQKADALYRKIQAFQEQQSIAPKEELETKYTRSLDDIKNEYAGWLYEKKNKKQLNSKTVLITAAVLVLLFGGYFFYTQTYSSAEILAQTNLPVFNAGAEEAVTATSKNPVNKKLPIAAKNKKNVTRNIKKKSVQKTEPVRKEKPPVNDISLPRLVTISGRYKPVGRGVSASEITIHNKSEENLKVVAVDVIYYKPDGAVLAKETVYFRNVDPQSSVTLKAPANEKAEEVKYKMGLISASETGLYYAMN